MGRHPKPTELKRIEGNPGKRPLSDDEPKPAGLVGEAPEWLDEIGRMKWNQKRAVLEPLGLLTDADDDFLAAYCDAYSEMVKATYDIREEGPISVSEKGSPYQNPRVGQKNKAVEKLVKIGALFGLSPSSRSGLHVDVKVTEEDEVALMMGS